MKREEKEWWETEGEKRKEEGPRDSDFGFPDVDTAKLGSGLRAGGAAFGSGLLVIGKGLGRVGTWLIRENSGHWGSVLVQLGLAFLLGYVYGVLR